MIVVFRRLIGSERNRLLILSAAMIAWFGLIMAVTKTAAGDMQAKTNLFQDSPLMKGFGITQAITPDAILAQLTGVSFNHPILLAIVGAVSVTHGARACQGELLSGTLELTLSRSISRTAQLLGYILFMVFAMTLMMVISFATIVGFERGLNVPGNLPVSHVAILCVVAGVVYFTFGAIAMLVSVLIGRRGSASFTAIGVLVAMFALTFAERGWPNNDALAAIGPISPFHFLDPTAILTTGDLTAAALLVPTGISVAAVLLAIFRFERRDL